jgi:hypothetical protein
MKENDVQDNEQEEDTLIPEYIELSEDERHLVGQLEDDILLVLDEQKVLLTVIEKLVAHIEKQNDQLADLALKMAGFNK